MLNTNPKLKTIKDLDEEVILTLPPEPLHTNLLGPVNDVLEKLEKNHEETMKNQKALAVSML